MASLLTDSEKEVLSNVFVDLHDTWARPIIVYREASRLVASSNLNFNALFDSPEPTNVPESRTILARIYYKKPQEKNNLNNSELDVQFPDGTVRLKVTLEDFAWFGQINRIELDGKTYSITSDALPHGLFNLKFVTLFLKPV